MTACLLLSHRLRKCLEREEEKTLHPILFQFWSVEEIWERYRLTESYVYFLNMNVIFEIEVFYKLKIVTKCEISNGNIHFGQFIWVPWIKAVAKKIHFEFKAVIQSRFESLKIIIHMKNTSYQFLQTFMRLNFYFYEII